MKILVSDFDRTFYTSDIEENVLAVNEFMEKGNIFIIATGRPLYLLKPDLNKYKIKYNYLICNDGAVIFDKNDKIIDKTNLEYSTTIDIFNLLKRSNEFQYVYVDAIYDFGELNSENYNGILAMPFNREDAISITESINQKYPMINCYLSHRWLNILNVEASKGKAIKFLQSKEKWNENDIYVIGDNKNDIPMMIFKNSFAVEDSALELINKSNNIIKDFRSLVEILKKQN